MLIGAPLPPLRPDLEISPFDHEGQPMFMLSDMTGLNPDTVAVPAAVVFVASLFDGKRGPAEVKAELAQHQVTVSEEEILHLADEMKKHGLLETPEARRKRVQALEDFRRSGVRPFRAEYRGLPQDPIEFGRFLNRFFKDPLGPGEPPTVTSPKEPPLGLIAPHIDFFRGGPLYAWAYGELQKSRPPDVIVAFGVAHMSPRSPWVPTLKAYETPYGPMEVDAELYNEIRSALWYDPLEEEWVHAKEHSLEFQALWLKHTWMKDTPKWVPILTSAFENFCEDAAPSSIESIEDGLQKIAKVLKERQKKGQRIMILAGIDLAHVGKRFGDEFDIDDAWKEKIEKADRESLEKALNLEADAFFLAGAGQNEWRKVCGLSALYSSLRMIRALGDGSPPKGRLLAYDQKPDPAGGIVSFTSAVFP